MKFKRLLAAMVLPTVVVAVAVIGIFYWQTRILPRVAVGGIAVGGMMPEQASQYLRKNLRVDYPDVIELTYGKKTWQVRITDVAAFPDYDQAAQQAYAIGHSGSFAEKAAVWIRQVLGRKNRSIPLLWKADPSKSAWVAMADTIAEAVFTAAEDAFLDPRTGQICPEKAGLIADMDRTLAQVVDAIAKGHNSAVVAVKRLPASITTRDIARGKVRFLLASFTTEFSGSNANRIHNITLAARKISGTLLKPGQEFSFNQVVGPCTLAAGFKPAMEIVRQEYVPGVGGGVCQVVTTLYNTVLLSGLKSTERRPHSLLVGYVPPGRDATVYYNTVDFKFRNTTNANLMIAAQVQGSSLTISIIGGEKPKGSYSLSHRIITLLQPKTEYVEQPDLTGDDMRVLRHGEPGYKVEVWRDGPDGTRERISVDQYPAKNTVVARNLQNTASSEEVTETIHQ